MSSNMRGGLIPAISYLVVLVSLPSLSWAQDAGTLLREQESRQPDRELPVPPREEDSALETAEPVEEQGQTVRVTALNLVGRVELLSAADRAALVASVEGQRLGIRGSQALVERTTARLQQQGHLLASALLPPQDITGGEVTLEIRQATLEGITIEPGDKVRTRGDLLRAVGEQPLGGDITRQNMEAGLLRLNELPGITARGRYTHLEYEHTDSIDRAWATGSVTGEYEVGGLVGYNEGSIVQSWAGGAVTGDDGLKARRAGRIQLRHCDPRLLGHGHQGPGNELGRHRPDPGRVAGRTA